MIGAKRTYLFIVDNEGDGYLGVVGPCQALKSLLAIAFEVAFERVVRMSGVNLWHGDGGWKVAVGNSNAGGKGVWL
jgi:hypothetical protein